MTLADYNSFCASLPHATHVVQWGGAYVWKVGGKVFAIAGWGDGKDLAVTFKCSPLSFDLLKQKRGLRPAPYLASRGMSWLQRTGPGSMNDAALKDYLRQSHRLASLNLPKKTQRALGLNWRASRRSGVTSPKRNRTKSIFWSMSLLTKSCNFVGTCSRAE